MATFDEILTSVGNELLDCLTPFTNPTMANIGQITPPSDADYPYIGYETARSRDDSGMGGTGGTRVSEQRNDEGMITSVTYERTFTLHLWGRIITADGDERRRNNIYTEIDDRFSVLSKHGTLHPDAGTFELRGKTDPQPSEGSIRSDRFELDVPYSRYRTYDDFEPMTTFNVDIDVDGSEAEPVDRTIGGSSDSSQ